MQSLCVLLNFLFTESVGCEFYFHCRIKNSLTELCIFAFVSGKKIEALEKEKAMDIEMILEKKYVVYSEKKWAEDRHKDRDRLR